MKTKNLRKFRSVIAALMAIVLVLTLIGCSDEKEKEEEKKSALDPKNPVTVTVWNYYNGDQLEAFNTLVEEFNSTVGVEKGIIVTNVSHGDIDSLADAAIASVNGEAGAQPIPSLAAVYAETAYILDQKGKLAALDSYFTQDELSAYVPGFLDEGRFDAENTLKLFPILKSTELFTANETDWTAFADATGVKLDSITTKEALTEAAKKYYEWTDSLTPDTPEDGKALYGRDSISNYIYIGTHQLGHDLFTLQNGKLTVDLDRDTFKTLWEHYYIPFINGYFGAYARFRSEDCKTGKILSLTSSSSSASYLPTAVTLQDDTSHDIKTYVTKDLPFENGNNSVVQQGASYCMFKTTEAEQEGAVTFLKWFTNPDRNLDFALMTGYSPVTLTANKQDSISAAFDGDTSTPKGENVLNALLVSADTFSKCDSYAVKPFDGSKELRTLLGDLLEQKATADRETVVNAINAGSTREDATAQFSTDAYFDAFFNDLKQQVTAITDK